MGDHNEHGLHVSSVKFNAIILGALLFLTFLTYWTATLDLGFLDTPLALAIAFTKTLLVILFFMHVAWASSYVKVLASAGFMFLIFLFGFTLADIETRTRELPWSDYTWPGAAHRTGIIPDGPSPSPSVEHETPTISHDEGDGHGGGHSGKGESHSGHDGH